jgi:hypothetical protein
LKKIAAIGLLALLLYNTFGLSVAVLFFDNQYKMATPVSEGDDYQTLKIYVPALPYSTNWENSDGMEGLVQANGEYFNPTHVAHKNDTLYVTLKSNQAARDHFFELANMMEVLTHPDSDLPDGTHGKAISLLDNLLKIYVQSSQQLVVPKFAFINTVVFQNYDATTTAYQSFRAKLKTPPPECA